ncbi:SCO4848 family membrane protein [Microbacterium sp. CJ88]|uniref:SCO4848 family membrane protein n=1 Tax=Microbacterium sp. CJ88 TaxID=3445672 RepID=UPI003F65D0A2
MTAAVAVVLFANAVFNAVASPQFLRRVAKDPRARDAAGRATPFLRVHVMLVTIALVLAAASLAGGILLLAAG